MVGNFPDVGISNSTLLFSGQSMQQRSCESLSDVSEEYLSIT